MSRRKRYALARVLFMRCAIVSVCSGTTGCFGPVSQHLLARVDAIRRDDTAHAIKLAMLDSDRRLKQRRVDLPWLAGKSVKLAPEAALPRALQGAVDTTLLFKAGESDLTVIAKRIQKASGIPVRVLPDALLAAHHFLPRLENLGDTRIAHPDRIALPAGPAPLPDVLDAVAAGLGVYWRYHLNQIEFFRIDVRVFQLRALAVAARAEVQLGRSARSADGGFQNDSNTRLSLGEHDTLDAVRARLIPFMSMAGTVAIQPGASGNIVVADTPPNLDRIARFLARENKALTQRVHLVFEEVAVDTAHLQEVGLDWNAIYRAGRSVLEAGVAASIPGATALRGTFEGRSFSGGFGIAAALAKYTTVLRHTVVPMTALNRRPVTHAVRTTFTYIDQIQHARPSAAASDVSLVAAVSQKEETVGAFLTVVPDVQEDGRVLLSIAYDNTVAQPLSSIQTGPKDSGLRIQQLQIDGSGSVQQIELRPGEPTLIAGFDREQSEAGRQRLTPDAPILFGGANNVRSRRITTLLFVTVQVLETAEHH